MRILLVKLSSMGDIIHMLPALSDAKAAIPNLNITWLVDEIFSEMPAWHPAVDQIITVALRGRKFSDIFAKIKEMRAHKYDMVIDAQGLIKSAIFVGFAKSKLKAGFARNSCKEPLASIFYNKRVVAPWGQPIIAKHRQLFAGALNYTVPISDPVFNITAIKKTTVPYLYFLHGTTWESKHWPEEYWLQLIDLAVAQGYKIKVTWATDEQKARAQKFADYSSCVLMMPHLTLNQAMQELNNAEAVVAVDTGFAHLAAALGKPVVTIFGATDVKQFGAHGSKSLNLNSNFACAPCMKRTCKYSQTSRVFPACMQELTPQLVWDTLQLTILNNN